VELYLHSSRTPSWRDAQFKLHRDSFKLLPYYSQRVSVALSLGVKRPGREAGHSSPSSVDVKNPWSCTATPPIRFQGVVLS
jgi:hypothetical protein